MKKYIGTKQVEAEPMTMGEAFRRSLLQAGRIVTDKEAPGYYVRYDNGYESWSPAEVFEKAYKIADTFTDRLLIERDELEERLNKLRQFIESPVFAGVVEDGYERSLLLRQETIMQEYLDILDERIDY